MKRYAPLLTLLAVAVLGVALLTITSVSNPANRNAADSAAPNAPAPSAAPAAPERAPAAAPAVAERAYAGRSAGNEVTVAIAVKDGRAVAYVCDGKKIEAWLEGTLQGERLTLQGRDGASIEATASEAQSFGIVTAAGGRSWPFAAKGVSSPAGLYEGRATRGVTARIGWVVEDDGRVTGVVNRNGVTDTAPALDPDNPGAVTIDGVPVAVTALDGDAQVVAR